MIMISSLAVAKPLSWWHYIVIDHVSGMSALQGVTGEGKLEDAHPEGALVKSGEVTVNGP